MYNASDYAVRVVLGPRINKKPHVIYNTSHTLNEAQVNYTVTEKEYLAVVFGFEKFRPYVIESHVIVLTDHATLKHLMEKKDAKPRLISGLYFYKNLIVRSKIGKVPRTQWQITSLG